MARTRTQRKPSLVPVPGLRVLLRQRFVCEDFERLGARCPKGCPPAWERDFEPGQQHEVLIPAVVDTVYRGARKWWVITEGGTRYRVRTTGRRHLVRSLYREAGVVEVIPDAQAHAEPTR